MRCVLCSENDISYALEIPLKKALLLIHEARQMFNIEKVCNSQEITAFFTLCVGEGKKAVISNNMYLADQKIDEGLFDLCFSLLIYKHSKQKKTENIGHALAMMTVDIPVKVQAARCKLVFVQFSVQQVFDIC